MKCATSEYTALYVFYQDDYVIIAIFYGTKRDCIYG